MKNWLDLNVFLGVPATQWLYAAIAAVISYLIISGVLRFVIVRLHRLASRTSTHVDDVVVEVLERTHRFTILVAALLIGSEFIDLPGK
ncbi:hypothetical protein SB861_40380 [Paraburkholderia sp. SIMBA_049]